MKDLELSLFNGFQDKTPKRTTLLQVVETIRSDKRLQVLTENHRLYLQRGDDKAAKREKQYAPCFAVAVRFNGGKDLECIEGWTGLSLVDFDDVPSSQLEDAFALICRDSHTMLAYKTLSGRGIRVLYKWKVESEELMHLELKEL